jgi:hypothetical protein
MLGNISVEWIFLSVLGLSGAFTLRHKADAFPALDYGWSTAVLLTLGFYVLLRFAGHTPEGIAPGGHPAVEGHPRLSVVVTVIVFAILSSRFV